MCTECGGLVCYADDSTYTVTAKSADELSVKLSTKFQEMSTYLRDNRLCINTDKTHMLVMCTQQKRNRNPNIQNVLLNTGAELISPTQTEWLLGVPVHQDLNFGGLLVSGKDSLVKSLNKRTGALKSLSKMASFKTRLSICSALIMSKILYMLPLYCGAPAYMMKALQKNQTEALRIVTNRKWKNRGQSLVSTKELLKQCNYMSVKQMAFYYSVAAVHKLLVNKQPEYLHQVVCEALTSGTKHRYPTSAAGKQPVKPAKLMMANTSFRWRASADYANLPLDLKEEKHLKSFLTRLKSHTRLHVPII